MLRRRSHLNQQRYNRRQNTVIASKAIAQRFAGEACKEAKQSQRCWDWCIWFI
ncbi:MAG: hypothetical protein V7L22_29910 [Nostoc sp.]|uniref:hypothetical protein n=1 Tax=Nostoc sp. TaxID=1180 RepID=UPI002FF71AEF